MVSRKHLFTLMAILSVFTYPNAPGEADQNIVADEYAVYSALLSPERTLSREDKKAGKEEQRLADVSRKKRPYLSAFRGEVLVVRQQTRSPEMLDEDKVKTVESSYLVGPDVKLDTELIDEFNSKNEKFHPLSNSFTADRKVVLLSKDESTEIFNNGGWDEFYKRYPQSGGIFMLSRVGFNANRDCAFLYIDSLSGPRTGAGYFVLLQKSKASGKWYIVKHIPLWIS
jgi:hypothetical protein